MGEYFFHSNTGALGFLTAVTQPTPEDLRKEIRKTRQLTKKPFGVNISFLPAAAPPDYDAYIKVIIEEGIKVVETAGNNPGKYIKMFKDGGCVVIHKCVNVRHANTAVRYGADIISMDGYECAGHPVRLLGSVCYDLKIHTEIGLNFCLIRCVYIWNGYCDLTMNFTGNG